MQSTASIRRNALEAIERALAGEETFRLEPAIAGLFAHQPEVAQDPALVDAVIRAAAAGQRQAIRLLGFMRVRAALPVLLECALDPGLATDAKEGIGCYEATDVLSELSARLVDADPASRARGVAAAFAVRWEVPVDEILAGALGDPHRDVRLTAAKALGDPSVRSSLPPLLDAIGDPDDEVGAAVIAAVGTTHDPAAFEPLAAALAATRPAVRAAAAAALGKVGDRRTIALLERAAADRAAEVRAGAARGLAALEDDASVRVLARLARDPSARVRREVARSLAYVRRPRAIRLLGDMLRDANTAVALDAVASLAWITQRSHRAEPTWARRAIAALGRARRDRRRQIRIAGARALADAKGETAARELGRLLRDRDAGVRLAAARALDDRFGDVAAKRILASARDDRDRRVRGIAGGPERFQPSRPARMRWLLNLARPRRRPAHEDDGP